MEAERFKTMWTALQAAIGRMATVPADSVPAPKQNTARAVESYAEFKARIERRVWDKPKQQCDDNLSNFYYDASLPQLKNDSAVRKR